MPLAPSSWDPVVLNQHVSSLCGMMMEAMAVKGATSILDTSVSHGFQTHPKGQVVDR